MTEQTKPSIVRKSVQQDQADPTRAIVTFTIHAKEAGVARDYAISDQLIEEGSRLCSQIPLMQVGLAERGVPIFCDAEGTARDIAFIPAEKQAEITDYYYTVTYTYIGIR